MEFDLSKKICYFFNEISKIPHGSRNEKALAEYIINFAKERNLSYVTDDVHNVIIYKNGSKGRENEVPVILQAHIDMVCEKNADVEFDFENEGIKLEVKDGWLKAQGTTLGADDGAGVAYILSVLDDETLSHPPLEATFTVMEEIGLIGALNLKPEYFKAKRYINLDGGGEVTTVVSCSGGRRSVTTIPVSYAPVSGNGYKLFITGLKGGHSGGTIHTNRGNSNKIIARLLNEVSQKYTLSLVSLNGGLKENAIPREATAVFASNASLEELNSLLAKAVESIKTELSESDPGLSFTLAQAEVSTAMDTSSTSNVIKYILLSVNGMVAPSMAIAGLTLASLNMGVIRTYDDRVEICYQQRSPIKSYLDQITTQLKTLAELCGGKNEIGAEYPGWSYEEKSELRELLRKVVKDNGKELICNATHGGLECGFFKSMIPDLDIVTYGPISHGEHTPEETMDLASFDRAYKVLLEVLEQC